MSIIDTLLHKAFGSPHERKVKKLRPIIEEIHKIRKELELLDDADLASKTKAFKDLLASGKTLEDIKVEAFAVCQEACDRRLGVFNIFNPEYGFDFSLLGSDLQGAVNQAKEELAAGKPEFEVYLPAALYAKIREIIPESIKPFRMMPFDVQMIGGLVLHEGAIAEMATGEGKTLAAALPVYLNGLSGKGVHVVTVNDYLAGRDAKQMGRVYNFLGLKVGLIINGLNSEQRRESYGADITYGTNNEFGFDYLRDNMALALRDRHQSGLHYAIVDEVDSILIDEALTPLIISGPADESPELYIRVNRIVPNLVRQETEEGEGDFWVDEKGKQVYLSEAGMEHAEQLLREAGIIADDSEGGLY